jgi:CHAT domain-containing protein
MMMVRDLSRKPDVKEEILSIRHSVGRWMASASATLQQKIEVREMAIFASDYANVDVQPKLPWAIKERDELVTDYGRYGATGRALQYGPVRQFLKEGKAQAMHFSCHGQMNVDLPTDSVLVLEDGTVKTGDVAEDEVRLGEGSQHPLVFLNACQLAAAGPNLGLITGWPQTFLEAGASACIAPLWSVVDDSARKASTTFYRLVFKENKTLGEALQEVRSMWTDQNNITFLSYVLYGDPNARVEIQSRQEAAPPKSAIHP